MLAKLEIRFLAWTICCSRPILLTNNEGQPTIVFMGSGFVVAGAFFVTVFYGKTGCVNGKRRGGRITVGR